MSRRIRVRMDLSKGKHMTTLDDQIRCIKRELALRRRVYPRLLQQGTLTQDQAAHEIRTMDAVLATLQALARAPRQETLCREEGPHADP